MRRLVITTLTMALLSACDRQAPRGAGFQVPVRLNAHQEMQRQPAPALKGFQTVAFSAVADEEPPTATIAELRSERMIVRSAQVRIVVANPAEAATALGAQVAAHGGYVSDSKQWRSGTQLFASLTLRVPATDLPATIEAIRHQAVRVESENVTGQDVTEEYTDLTAQLTNLRLTETELRALLTTVRQRARKAADILEVFNRLAEVRGEIDQAQGRINSMNKLTTLATINVDLLPDVFTQPLAAQAWQPAAAVRSAFRTLLSTLRWLFDGAIWLLIYVLPVVVAIALPTLGIAAGTRAVRKQLLAR